jgi:hypothetical protein
LLATIVFRAKPARRCRAQWQDGTYFNEINEMISLPQRMCHYILTLHGVNLG